MEFRSLSDKALSPLSRDPMDNSREIPDFKNLGVPHSQLVREGQEFLLKAPVETLRVF